MNKKTKFVVPQIYKAKRLFLFPLIGQILQYLSGWKIEGTLPNINKIVVVCAPHTSNWDFIIGMMMVLSIDIRVNFLAKNQFLYLFSKLY